MTTRAERIAGARGVTTRADRIAGAGGLRRLLADAAERYRALGRVGGWVRLPDLSPAEARAIAHLGVTGRALPRASATAEVSLRRLDVALADAGGLLAVLAAAGHDLTTRAEGQAHADAAVERAWSAAAASAHAESTAAWVASLRSRRRTPPAALDAVLRVLEILGGHDGPWDRARLATEATGRPHELDDGSGALGVLVSALSFRESIAPPDSAGARRALLARHGIVVDPLSSTVLLHGVRARGDGPAVKLLQAADGGHAVLTLAQIAESALQPIAGRLFCCEGPVVVRAAEQGSGAPLVCTDGHPSAACDALLRQLCGRSTQLHHSGDFDWGGLRIAALMQRRFGARPWRHDRRAYLEAIRRVPGRAPSLGAPRGAPPAAFADLWQLMRDHGIRIWQEDMVDQLIDDLQNAG